MEEKRFKKIDGIEALHRILDGERVFDHVEGAYQIKDRTMYYLSKDGIAVRSDMTINAMTMHNDWYIKNPFDVRQEMFDRPNEWVGKFKDGSEWWAVGFDTKHFNVIGKPIQLKAPVDTSRSGMTFPRPEDLDACIDINEVIKLVTR